MNITTIQFSAVVEGKEYSTIAPVGTRVCFNLETREFYEEPYDENEDDEEGYIKLIPDYQPP